MEKQFFTELSKLLADKQELRLNITKTGEQLTVLATVKGKHITASGTPEEMDQEFLSHLNAEVEAKTFTFNVSDSNKEVEEEEETVEKTAPASKKKEVAKPAIKVKAKPEVTVIEEAEVIEEIEGPAIAEAAKVELAQTPEKPKAEAPKEKVSAEAANKTRTFNHIMSEGSVLFKDRKYAEAQVKYKEALAIFPEDKTALLEEANSAKWIKAMEAL